MHKPNATLGTIGEAPFHAVPGDVGTNGGAVTDSDARVLHADGTQILGAYATGVSATSGTGPVSTGAGVDVGASFV